MRCIYALREGRKGRTDAILRKDLEWIVFNKIENFLEREDDIHIIPHEFLVGQIWTGYDVLEGKAEDTSITTETSSKVDPSCSIIFSFEDILHVLVQRTPGGM